MLETKNQQRIVAGILAVVLTATVASSCGSRRFDYASPDGTQHTSADVERARAYLKYLESVPTDRTASNELFRQLLSEQDVKAELERKLKVQDPVELPAVADAEVAKSGETGAAAVRTYLERSLSAVSSYNALARQLTDQPFGDREVATKVGGYLADLIGQLKAVPVPAEAAAIHKSLLSNYKAYQAFYQTSAAYGSGGSQEPWPEVYHLYGAMDAALTGYERGLDALDAKYKLADAGPLRLAVSIPGEPEPNIPFVKTAHAFLGIGDFTINVTIGDIPRLIFDAIKVAVVNSFSKFILTFLQGIVNKIESNYAISNYLYYTDALVAGQYSDDYLKKYVADGFDRDVIKKFIPQLTCNRSNENLRPIFLAKAQDTLGFDPEGLSPQDPSYFTKLAQVGNFLAQPEGWQVTYRDLAAQAASEAEKSADRELTSLGLKSPRDATQLVIQKSLTSLDSTMKASLNNLLNVGTAVSTGSGFQGLITSLITTVTQAFISNFVFRGATNAPLSVLKEQSTCVAALQLSVVVPSAQVDYVEQQVDQNAIQNSECAKLPRGCDTTPAGTATP